MELDWTGLAVAVGICVSVAVLEGAITPDAVKTWYPTLVKPWWNLPFAAFVTVAIVVYVIDGFVAYRLWAVATLPGSRAIGLTALVVVMVFNAQWNCALFATRNTLVGWLGLLAFLAPLLVLQVALFVFDALAAWTHLLYVAWVVGYDLHLFYCIWRLNPPRGRWCRCGCISACNGPADRAPCPPARASVGYELGSAKARPIRIFLPPAPNLRAP